MEFSKNVRLKTEHLPVKDCGQPSAAVHGSHKTSADDINANLPPEVQQEIEDLCYFVPEVTDLFQIIDKIGEGTFSSVFLARLRRHPDVTDLFALKHIIPTSHPNRILGELTCLQLIGGKENVMGVELCLRNKDHIVIVMKYFPHDKFPDYFNTLDIEEVQDYMRNLLIALKHVHELDIIHRDIKPSNFLHSTKTKQYMLVDFGLAHDAPVRLRTANKGRSPIVKEIRPWSASRDHDAKDSDKKTKEDADKPPAGSDKMQAKISSVPLALPVARISPSKRESVGQSIRTPGESRPVQILVPSPLYSKGKAARTQSDREDIGGAAVVDLSRHSASISPRRRALQRSMMKNDGRKTGEVTTEVPQMPSSQPHSSLRTCDCYGRPIVCAICYSRSAQTAQRAGTPGFRAPEVLMKHPQQSTAVDMWSAGVIFLSLLSGRYPFFRGNDDLTCLSQIISLLGTEQVQTAAKSFDKLVTCRPILNALDLKSLCLRLRSCVDTSSDSRHSTNPTRQWPVMPDSAIDLLKRLLDPDPHTRITAEDALRHSFFFV